MRLVRLAPISSSRCWGAARGSSTQTDLQAVTPDAHCKDRFVHRGCGGGGGLDKVDTQTLERKRSVSFEKLLEAVAWARTMKIP